MLGGVLLALLTSASWAMGNVFIQRSSRTVGTPRAMLWALLAGAALSGALSPGFDHRAAPLTAATWGWAVVAALAALLAYVCLFYSVERAPLSIAVPLVSSWSVIATVFAAVVLHERPTPGQLAGAALVIAGVLCVSIAGGRGAASGGMSARRAVLAGFGSALGFGVMVPAIDAAVAPAAGAFGATGLVYGLGIAIGVPAALALRVPLSPPPARTWPLLVVTGLFETFGFVALAFAHRFAPNAVVTPVSSLAAALTVLYAWVVLRERPHPLAAVGAVLASLGIVVLAR